jgi:RNA polymerase sigma factor (sigma-70 family)
LTDCRLQIARQAVTKTLLHGEEFARRSSEASLRRWRPKYIKKELKEEFMLDFQPTVRTRLVGIVNGLTGDRSLREDLTQEAMLHFWKMECERPGQTLSWYLQSCSFHLRHYLASGRSIDSSKRRSLQIEMPQDADLHDYMECRPDEHSILAQVEVHECIRLLPRFLTPREQAILRCLFEGLTTHEIASHLILSHPTVNKCRRKIAALAIRLGIGPRSPGRSRRRRVVRSRDTRNTLPAAVAKSEENTATRNGWLPHGAAAFLGFDPIAAKNIDGFRDMVALVCTVRDRSGRKRNRG